MSSTICNYRRRSLLREKQRKVIAANYKSYNIISHSLFTYNRPKLFHSLYPHILSLRFKPHTHARAVEEPKGTYIIYINSARFQRRANSRSCALHTPAAKLRNSLIRVNKPLATRLPSFINRDTRRRKFSARQRSIATSRARCAKRLPLSRGVLSRRSIFSLSRDFAVSKSAGI